MGILKPEILGEIVVWGAIAIISSEKYMRGRGVFLNLCLESLFFFAIWQKH